ncbi:MAG: MurR/RpiR family transcriptional regulator [Porticoccaceae bacterium]|nr:MurR/RpiR family transcriptional regulator [Porticoccaceae bacterium]
MTTIQDFETLRQEISNRHSELSKRLRQIAQFALDHPTDMALETIAVIAERAQVQPSALIRFAKAFGYSGFSEMQRAFQTRVHERSANYRERVRAVSTDDLSNPQSPEHSLLNQFCKANIVALEELLTESSAGDIAAAVDMLDNASTIYIMGQRRSFPVAAYLAYALNHAGCKAVLLDGIGGMLFEHAHMTPDDVLLATSFSSYAHETTELVSKAAEAGTPIVVITDSSLSPIANAAKVCLLAHDAEVHSFRSLASAMTLAQALATSLAFRHQED